MISFPILLAALSLSTAVTAAPVSNNKRGGQVFKSDVKFIRPQNLPLSGTVARDRARLEAYKPSRTETSKAKRASGTGTSAPITNLADTYVAAIGVGSPATTYSLIVDTGSSNTWVGAGTAYTPTSTSNDTGESVSVTYGSGSFSGEEYTDDVTLTDGLTLTGQGVGVANTSSGFSGVDGILGVGPVDLTEGTLSDQSQEIPTVIQTAYQEGLIPAQVLGVFFAPPASANDTNGEITYGGIDSSKTTGNVEYTSVVSSSTAEAGYYWGIGIDSLSGDNTTYSNGTQYGIVDTGTTLIYLPTDWYSQYQSAITGASVDQNSGLLSFPKSSLDSVPDLTFTIGSNTFAFNKYAQLVESSLYSTFGLDSSDYYSWIADSGTSDTGLDFILGQKWIERYYSVFDTDNSQVGFATTANTNPTSAS